MELLHIPSPRAPYANTFLLFTAGGHAVAIDPDAPAQRYREALEQHGATLSAIFLTHGHYDHVGAALELQKTTGATLYLDPADTRGTLPAPFHLFPIAEKSAITPYPESGTLTVDELTFRFWHTPGHSLGSYCIYTDGLLFSGDTLFTGSCGRIDLPGGSRDDMQNSLAMLRDLPLPDQTSVFPGHDVFTTLGEERENNPYMQGLWF